MSQREQANRACAEAGVEATNALVTAIAREIGLAENASLKYITENVFREIAKLGEDKQTRHEDMVLPETWRPKEEKL